MSFLSDFEDRISSVFDSAPKGYTAPFSFKRLAKRAAREMENETYEIDGVDTAPALYTVLVSSEDDALMRPLYQKLTFEVSEFITASASKKGYSFVGKPLVRFMVDQTLRPGKFAVFAENVDSRTLERLRKEERAFLGGNSMVGGAAAEPKPAPAAPAVPAVPGIHSAAKVGGPDDGLEVMPSDYLDSAPAVIPAIPSPSSSTPMPVTHIDGVAAHVATAAAPAPAPRHAAVPDLGEAGVPDVPATQRRASAEPPAHEAAHVAAPKPPATCILIDRQGGRTYTASAPTCVIGRERSQCGVVLRDPNVSRRHAELSFDGANWHILDLRSTNGTLVNDIDIDECVLRDGDLITVGLVNLEFREN